MSDLDVGVAEDCIVHPFLSFLNELSLSETFVLCKDLLPSVPLAASQLLSPSISTVSAKDGRKKNESNEPSSLASCLLLY
ncbi:hypothetical protein PanWU01x14_197230 [Parasponia andersonii]|uniref:Uncharacterized protein n=1 Tax=Parasponia andersonii TaxID=3476 RepID=A0A2P5BZF7_PARAD|nr:hypothetical protein PanWU01x14_197230 [Parasponia andersonii]